MTTYRIILKNGMYLQKYSYLSTNSPKNTKLGIELILSHRVFFWTVRYAIFSCVHEYLRKPEKLRENSGKMGYTNQLLIALVYKTGTKLMLRQNSSTLVKYVNYLIVISININENCRSKRKFVKREKQEKRSDKLTSQSSFTRLFNILMTLFMYSRISKKY